MQQTAIDRWLRKKFIYIHRVYCNTLPKKVPFGIKVETSPEESGGRYLYKLSTRSEGGQSKLADLLANESITFTSRVEDRNVWYARFLNNPHKSLTYRVAWALIAMFFGLLAAMGMPQKVFNHLVSDQELIGEEKELVTEIQEVDNDARIYEMQDRLMEIDRLENSLK